MTFGYKLRGFGFSSKTYMLVQVKVCRARWNTGPWVGPYRQVRGRTGLSTSVTSATVWFIVSESRIVICVVSTFYWVDRIYEGLVYHCSITNSGQSTVRFIDNRHFFNQTLRYMSYFSDDVSHSHRCGGSTRQSSKHFGLSFDPGINLDRHV